MSAGASSLRASSWPRTKAELSSQRPSSADWPLVNVLLPSCLVPWDHQTSKARSLPTGGCMKQTGSKTTWKAQEALRMGDRLGFSSRRGLSREDASSFLPLLVTVLSSGVILLTSMSLNPLF